MDVSIDVNLVIVGVDMTNGQKYIVCTVNQYKEIRILKELPTQRIEKHNFEPGDPPDLLEYARLLFTSCTNLSSNWISLSLASALFNYKDLELELIYTCEIPLDTELHNNHEWETLSNIFIEDNCPQIDKAILSCLRNT